MIFVLKTFTVLVFVVLSIVVAKNVTYQKLYMSLQNRLAQGLEFHEEELIKWIIEVIKYNLTKIHTLKEVYKHVELLAQCPYGHVKMQNLTIKKHRARLTAVTAKGNNIPYLNISIGSYVQKPAIVVVAGIHGCDWLGVAALINAAQQLILHYIENYEYTNKLSWIIVPILNPDGYNATMNYKNMTNWPKNMFQPENETCFGVDLMKNFEYQWLNYNFTNASWCDLNYADTPFSQNESRALRDTISDNLDTIKIYTTVTQKQRAIMYPFRYTSTKPLLWEFYERIVKEAAKAASMQYSRTCLYGHALNFQKKTAGNVDDWIKAHFDMDLAFTYEVSNITDNNHLEEEEIKLTNDEVFAALKVIAMKGASFEKERYLLLYLKNSKNVYMFNIFILIFVLLISFTILKL